MIQRVGAETPGKNDDIQGSAASNPENVIFDDEPDVFDASDGETDRIVFGSYDDLTDTDGESVESLETW